MQQYEFTPKTHPELYATPLGGAYLAEFARLVEDKLSIKRALPRGSAYLQSSQGRLINDAANAVDHALITTVTNGSKHGYAPDRRDMDGVVKRIVQDYIDQNSALLGEGHPRIFEENAQVLHNVIGRSKGGLFSVALAMQECKEDDLVEISRDTLQLKWKQAKELTNEQDASNYVQSIAAAAIFEEKLIEKMRARGSQAVGLVERLTFGEEYHKTGRKGGYQRLLEKAMEVVLGADPKTQKGKLLIARGCRDAKFRVNEFFGFAPERS